MFEICLAFSTHIALAGDWNERHPCIRYTNNSWTVGAFLNSENTISGYGSYTFETDGWFLEAGIVTGYSGFEIAPMIRTGYEFNDNIRIFAAPAATVKSDYGIILGVELSQGL